MSSGFNPGELRHRVEILKPVDVSDGAGGADRSWVSAGTVWAKVSPKKMYGIELAAQSNGHSSHEVVMRFRNDVLSGQQLQFGNRLLKIVATADMAEEGRFLQCSCQEEGR